MLYGVPDSLTSEVGIEALYLQAVVNLGNAGCKDGSKEMFVRSLCVPRLLDLELPADFVENELNAYIPSDMDIIACAKECLKERADAAKEDLVALLGADYVRGNIDCMEVLYSLATKSSEYDKVVDVIEKRTEYYGGV